MTSMTLQIVFAGTLVLMSLIGFFCAAKLSEKNPLWVRLIVLYPSLAALCTLTAMLRNHYLAYAQDIIMAVGLAMLYALVASHFTDKNWLNIKGKHESK